jgi:small subunit ribosomal protein S4e
MVRGPKKHLKLTAASKSLMLDKLVSVYTTRCSSGPHKLHESMPMQNFLRNRLKYALTAKECRLIMKQRLIMVDGSLKVRPFLYYNRFRKCIY